MADSIVTPIHLPGYGRSECKACMAVPNGKWTHIFGVSVEICDRCLAGLRRMGEEFPERLFSYVQYPGKWYYGVGVRESGDAAGPNPVGGDHDVPYRFGRLPTIDKLGTWSAKQYLALVKLRSTIQDQIIAAHARTVHPDGF